MENKYLNRCCEIAKLGIRTTKSNPMVGAVIVYNNRIIGEGYHKIFGQSHAEVNALNSIKAIDKIHLPKSTMYVSLEPCSHHGKTPPCVDAIISSGIKTVVIGCLDPTKKSNGKGQQYLEENNIAVTIANNHVNCIELMKTFSINIIDKRPISILKFAKSKDNFFGKIDKQVWLSNKKTSILTHKLRSESDGILIGTNTAIIDNPSLTLRNYPGLQPLRIVLDKSHRIPISHTLLSDDLPTLIITDTVRSGLKKEKQQLIIDFESDEFLSNLLTALYQKEIYRLMVEGGSKLLKSFLKKNLWDEALIINTPHALHQGIKAPNITGILIDSYKIEDDEITWTRRRE